MIAARVLFLACLAYVGLVANCQTLFEPACDGKQVIVHLFEWTWRDIALECERFLGPAGFCGVQVSPPQEHMHDILQDTTLEEPFPWWERYQPISYILQSRSGTEAELKDMLTRCNAVGVRIFVDAVVNHMAAGGRSGVGTAGSSFDGDTLDFPGVPYFPNSFTASVDGLCVSGDGNVNNYADEDNVRNCNLVGLNDLYGAEIYVQGKVADYFNSLVDIGVAGFRVDAAKHMWPNDLKAMIDQTNDLNTDFGFPAGSRPFFYHEVIDQNDGAVTVDEYYDLGRVTEFRYCQKVTQGIMNGNLRDLFGVYDPDWGMSDPEHAFVFVDNHDNQRTHVNTITHTDPLEYRLAIGFTLAQPYGYTKIMSSFFFGDNTDLGPPHYSDFSTKDVEIDDTNLCPVPGSSPNTNGQYWICEHRWLSIYKMVRFRNAVAGTEWFNQYSDDSVLAFSRGDLGFFAMSKAGTMDMNLQTGMPAGSYKDIISCNDVTVNSDGTAQITITDGTEPVFAICQGCICDAPATVTATPGPDRTTLPTTQGPTEPPITDGIYRTVIFVEKETITGQDLFVRGGISTGQSKVCTSNVTTDPCAIDITINSLGTTTHYDQYNAYRVGDTKLDWFGAESGQGTYLGATAEGTALAWTSSSSSSLGYQSLNTYGDHFWMLDIEMDCSETENGWFEVKAYLTNDAIGWESDISQATVCTGTAGGAAPYTSVNHLGKCGFVNVFTFGVGACKIEEF